MQNAALTLTYGGETLSLSEWAERTGFSRSVIAGRVKSGWDPKKVLMKPMKGFLSRMDPDYDEETEMERHNYFTAQEPEFGTWYMSDEELIRAYREAKYPLYQIQVLADLNDTSYEIVFAKLMEIGAIPKGSKIPGARARRQPAAW